MKLSKNAKLNAALLAALLFTLPLASAFGMITGSVLGHKHRVVDQEQPFYIELIDGTHEFYITLDKPAPLPVISMQMSGYAVGNFTVWIEPEGGGPKLKLAESKIVQEEGIPLITGFVAGGKGKGNAGGISAQGNKGKSANAPGHNPSASPGKSGQAPGQNKAKAFKAANKKPKTQKTDNPNAKTKSKSRRRLERLLNFLQGMLKGEAAFKARQKQQSDRGVILKPQKFKRTCSDTCSISRPMVQSRYKVTAAVEGKLEVHSVQYAVVQRG